MIAYTHSTELAEMKKKWIEYNSKHYSGKRNKIRNPRKRHKTPWYVICSGKQYNYEERNLSWGTCVSYFRVPSEAKRFHDKTLHKLSHMDYLSKLAEAKLKDWDKKNPRPVPYDPQQRDLFEAEFNLPWISARTTMREKIIEKVLKSQNRATVYARYEDDVGYPHRLFTISLKGYELQLKDGSFNNAKNNTILRVQRAANRLKEQNPSLVALKIINGNSSRIIIPL